MYHIHFIKIAIQMWFARVVGALTLKNHLMFAEAEIPVVCGSEWLAGSGVLYQWTNQTSWAAGDFPMDLTES